MIEQTHLDITLYAHCLSYCVLAFYFRGSETWAIVCILAN